MPTKGSVVAEVYVEPVRLDESGEEIRVYAETGEQRVLRLRRFQVDVMRRLGDESAQLILLEAPTGAGKTLTLLLTPYRGAVALYPNRELLRDQADNLAKTLTRLGFKPANNVPEEYRSFVSVFELSDTMKLVTPLNKYRRVILAEVSSSTVEKTMGSRFRTIYGFAELLSAQMFSDTYYVILTTPDTWISLLAATYRSYEDLGKTIKTIYESRNLEEAEERVRRLGVARKSLLGKMFSVAFTLTNVLFVDEFHVYGEYEYAMLEPVLWAAELFSFGSVKIVLSSATPRTALADKLARVLGVKLDTVKATGGAGGVVVRGRTRILFWDTRAPAFDDVAGFITAGWRFIEQGIGSDVFIDELVKSVTSGYRVLGVFDKVSQATEFARALGGAVCKTSVVDPRVCVVDDEYPVIVGSAAVTQGVDYPDISFGVVSRYAPIHVLQALGRFARRLSEATVIIPVHREAAKKAAEHDSLTIDYWGLRELLVNVYGYWDDPHGEYVPHDILEARRELIRALVTLHYARATGHKHVLRNTPKPRVIDVVGPVESYAGLVRFRRTGFTIKYRVEGTDYVGEADVGVIIRNYEIVGADPDGTIIIDTTRRPRRTRGQITIHWPLSTRVRVNTVYSLKLLAETNATLLVTNTHTPLPQTAHTTLVYLTHRKHTPIILGHALPDANTATTNQRQLMYLFI